MLGVRRRRPSQIVDLTNFQNRHLTRFRIPVSPTKRAVCTLLFPYQVGPDLGLLCRPAIPANEMFSDTLDFLSFEENVDLNTTSGDILDYGFRTAIEIAGNIKRGRQVWWSRQGFDAVFGVPTIFIYALFSSRRRHATSDPLIFGQS